MIWLSAQYALLPFLVSRLALSLALIAKSRRNTPGSGSFILLMLAVSEWSLARSCEALAIGIPAKVFWAKIEYLGIMSVPPLWLLFSATYRRKKKTYDLRNSAFLWVIPVLTWLAVASNEQHRQFWSAISPSLYHPEVILVYSHGPLFWAAAVYN